MSGTKFTDEFKRDALAQVEDPGYPVLEVAERLGAAPNRSTRGSGCFRGRLRWSRRSMPKPMRSTS